MITCTVKDLITMVFSATGGVRRPERTHKLGPHRNGPSVHGRAETFWSSVSQVWLGDLLFQHLTSLSPLAFLTDGLYRWQGME